MSETVAALRGSIKHIYGTLEQSTVHIVHYRRVKPLLHCTCLASSQHINKTMKRHHASLAVLSLAAACSGLTATVTKTLPAPPPAPRLTAADEALLRRSGRVERVERDGRVGAAWAVVDSAMAADDAWTVIREVENYDRTIRGVKAAALRGIEQIAKPGEEKQFMEVEIEVFGASNLPKKDPARDEENTFGDYLTTVEKKVEEREKKVTEYEAHPNWVPRIFDVWIGRIKLANVVPKGFFWNVSIVYKEKLRETDVGPENSEGEH